MGRGKPKRIRRKSTETEPTLSGKMAMSLAGDIATYKEESLIMGVLLAKCFRLDFLNSSAADIEILKLFKDAVLTLNAGFFERCIEVIKWHREGRPSADPKGTAVFDAVWHLALNESKKCKISSHEVTTRILDSSKGELHIEPKDVREIWAAMGMGRFPVSIATIRKHLLNEDGMGELPEMFTKFREYMLGRLHGLPQDIIIPARRDASIDREVYVQGIGRIGSLGDVSDVKPQPARVPKKQGE